MDNEESRKAFLTEQEKSRLASENRRKEDAKAEKKKSESRLKTYVLLSALAIVIFLVSKLWEHKTIDSESSGRSVQAEQSIKEAPITTHPIGFGKITTIADGYDVKRVNLWSSTNANRTINSYVTNGEKINILADEDPYYLIETSNGDGKKGYCMKEFVVKSK